ncbi:hypothetical protein SPOG_05681 [Schizosaccharomyces cryophilus OY26]|uniref:Uncharacterized protein n=1 Tax=Schizosaccharomyces cryophilus (strain OY26 / ATCC MYA-4695 / CBS 11777 / NBRC 106824 / NRRL Y48691) TaxID=653667 RepID=S9W163_SCHCR|nr:uncharacterized protein SPOG_05681 [Schizosaccharomyces cryophilus OY26]EPY52244.1 hypothetical protein SPOG_05681 [Schizosaccharomyces cryophilus OY26]
MMTISTMVLLNESKTFQFYFQGIWKGFMLHILKQIKHLSSLLGTVSALKKGWFEASENQVTCTKVPSLITF